MKNKNKSQKTLKIAGNYLPAIVSFILLVFLDQFTKYLVDSKLSLYESIPVIKNVFHIMYIQNQGAAWGIFKNQQLLFCIVAALSVVFGCYFYHKCVLSGKFYDLRILTVLIMAGAVGNMIDRISLKYVIDFLYFKLIDFPVFNIADCYVTIGFFILIIMILFKYTEDDIENLWKQNPKK